MRKQYDCYETFSFRYNIDLYHDGVKVATEKKRYNEMADYIRQLEAQGYTPGYLKEDVEKARLEYEHRYANRIERD
jgi:hypothetical protein